MRFARSGSRSLRNGAARHDRRGLVGRAFGFSQRIRDHRGERFLGLDAGDMIFRFQVAADPLRNPFDGAQDDAGQFIDHAGAISERV